MTSYALDLYAGLTQVLWDGENVYLYGLGRIGEEQPGGWAYHLADALGSVRQLADEDVWVTLAQSFKPFGDVLESEGDGETAYAFTGQWRDATGLLHLRARYYDAYLNEFIQPDPIIPRAESPQDWNRYSYARNNPINLTDPSGTTPYDRYRAAAYAIQWATSVNPLYGKMSGDNDCTHFVSQALLEGGFPEDDQWFFDARSVLPSSRCTGSHYRWLGPTLLFGTCSSAPGPPIPIKQSFCGNAWAITDNLYRYLTQDKGFSVTRLQGYLPPTPPAVGRVLPIAPHYIDFPWSVWPGDVVFYRQLHAPSVGQDGGTFNHMAIVVGLGNATKQGQVDTTKTTWMLPHIVDHSSDASEWGRRAINDTWSEVNMIDVVHIPDVIP